MNEKEFITKKLNLLFETFTGIKIRYEYRMYTHFIEILPLELFESNQDYILSEMKIEEEFETLFNTDNILFISSDSLNKIETPILILN